MRIADHDLARLLASLIAEELAFHRRGEDLLTPQFSWGQSTLLRDPHPSPDAPTPGTPQLDSLDLDSLEALACTHRVADYFHLHDAGVEDRLHASTRLGDWMDAIRSGWERGAGHVAFRSSGTTAAPTRHSRPIPWLEQEVHALAALVGRPTRVISLVAPHHVYGLLATCLLPAEIGARVVDGRPWSPQRLARELAPGDLVVAIPMRAAGLATFLKQSTGSGGSPAIPPDVLWMSAAGPLDPGDEATLRSAGLAHLLEIYGSTETLGVGYRRSTADAFRLHDYFEPVGPRTLRRSLLGGDHALIELPDEVAWGPDGGPGGWTFELRGRADGGIKVAGVNVFPDRVSRALKDHPLVADAAVRLEGAGEPFLKAYVVPSDATTDLDVLRRELRRWAGRTLDAPSRPRAWTFGPAVPRTAMGKVADWALEDAAPPG